MKLDSQLPETYKKKKWSEILVFQTVTLTNQIRQQIYDLQFWSQSI